MPDACRIPTTRRIIARPSHPPPSRRGRADVHRQGMQHSPDAARADDRGGPPDRRRFPSCRPLVRSRLAPTGSRSMARTDTWSSSSSLPAPTRAPTNMAAPSRTAPASPSRSPLPSPRRSARTAPQSASPPGTTMGASTKARKDRTSTATWSPNSTSSASPTCTSCTWATSRFWPTSAQLWHQALILNRPGRPRDQIGTDVASGLADLEAYGQMVLCQPGLRRTAQDRRADERGGPGHLLRWRRHRATRTIRPSRSVARRVLNPPGGHREGTSP